jgi:hypothetical protein
MRRGLTALALLAGFAIPFSFGTTGCDAPRAGGPPRGGIQFDRDHGPFLKSQRLTLAGAEAAFGSHLLRPSHSLANDDRVRAVFFERIPGDPNEDVLALRTDLLHVAIDYDSGVLITIELVKGTGSLFETDPAQQYAYMLADAPVGSSVQDVHGVSALLLPADAAGEVDSVDLTLGGERISVSGEYADIELNTLIDIANTLD